MPLALDSIFRSILDQLFLGVLIIDQDGRIIFYNQRMGELDELGPEDTLGYKINEVYSVREEDSPSMVALRTGRVVDGQFMAYRTARGRQLNTLNHAYPIFGQGETIGAICLVTDVTSLMAATWSDHGAPAPRKAGDPKEKRINFDSLIGKSPLFREAIDVAKVAAGGPSPVMLVGETGTGKDLFARAIHDYGARAGRKFTALNCSAIPEALLEGILFGTTKGAFTGAADKEGLLEHASGGTLFLDEINSMPLTLQAKLLRVLQDHRVRRVGGLTEKEVDLRIISASNLNPLQAIERQTLRADLYYRLGVVQVRIPPLRERPEDIPHLANFFMERLSHKLGKKVAGLSNGVLQSLKSRPWPGNVRELEHAIESALNFVADGETLSERHLRRTSRHLAPAPGGRPGTDPAAAPPSQTAPEAGLRPRPLAGPDESLYLARRPDGAAPLNRAEAGTGRTRSRSGSQAGLREEMGQAERNGLAEALVLNRGIISRAAASLGLSPQLMSYKMKKYNLKKEDFQGQA